MARPIPKASNPAHQRWFEDALLTLGIVHHVDRDIALAHVNNALALADELGESPESLHGKARDWANAKAEEFREDPELAYEGVGLDEPHNADGRPDVFDGDLVWNPRLVVIASFGIGAWIAILFALAFVFTNGLTARLSIGALIAPLLLGTLIAVLIRIYDALKRRVSALWANIGAAVLVIVGAVIGALSFSALREPAWNLTPFVFVGIAAILALACWGVSKVWPLPASENDDHLAHRGDWDQLFVSTARARGDIPESRIRSILEEAHAHVSATGANIRDEFGDPVVFARSLPRNDRVRVRRELYVLIGICVFMLVMAVWAYVVHADPLFGVPLYILWSTTAVFSGLQAFSRWRKLRK